MKKLLKTIAKPLKVFFASLWQDLVQNMKHHWLKMIGYFISFFFPMIYLLVSYVEKKPESWALPVFVWIPVIVFMLVYWFKIRTYLVIKLSAMQVKNDLQKGKYAAAIIICKTFQVAMTVAPFVLFYYVFDSLAKLSFDIQNIFMLLTICEAVGGLFIIIDTIANVIDLSDKK